MNQSCRRPIFLITLLLVLPASAQTPPSAFELANYRALLAAVVQLDMTALERQIASGAELEQRDNHGRTALHLAAYYRNHAAMRKLVAAGANPNALERDDYDIITIAAVANDLPTLKLGLELGCRADNVTSRYAGTALIAAAHLGHVEIVQTLISAGAPLDHVNNLAWTALIESIVLGDGGARHTATLKALVDAGASVNLADGNGDSPLELAQARGYQAMAEILLAAGAR